MVFDAVLSALQDMREGRMVILVDDEDRENEGDLCVAAQGVTPEHINFMATHGRGLICLALTEERIEELDLPMMVTHNTSPYETAFTVSIEAARGVTTGISAADRAQTIRVAVDPSSKPDDLVRPGHVFPLRARRGGCLVRTGQTEGSVDLARLAGLCPAAVICEIIRDDGSMARMPDLEAFAKLHGIRVVTIAELIQYRLANETLVRRLETKHVRHPQWGEVTLCAYGTSLNERQHLAVIKGDILSDPPPLVRVHSGYPLSSVFGDLFSNDRQVLNAALNQLGQEQRGVLLCIDQGDGPLPLDERIRQLGEEPKPKIVKRNAAASERMLRELGVGAQILRHLGLTNIRLLITRPKRLKGLEAYGITVVDEVPLTVGHSSATGRRFEVLTGSGGGTDG